MYIGGLDVGTTGCKLTVYGSDGTFVCNTYEEYAVSRKRGAHEADANVIFGGILKVLAETYKKCPELSAVGVTTFGETFVLLDKDDSVLLPSMLYTDPRGAQECAALSDAVGEDRLIEITGTKPNEMFSLPKLMWIKKNRPDVFSRAKRAMLMQDFAVYMLTGKAQIDFSLAARTMAFDIRQKRWSAEIFAAAGIDPSLMSAPVPTGSIAGVLRAELAEKLGFKNLNVINGAHDQVAAAVGAGVLTVGTAVDGTGTVECVTPMFDRIPTDRRLYDEGYTVVPYIFDGTYVCYALSFTGGAVLKWYRDNFARFECEQAEKTGANVYAELDGKMSNEPTDLLVLPHFAGAANPHMDINSRAAILGLTLEHTASDVYKALLEGVTYEILLNLKHLEKFGISPEKLYATGGGASSEKWLQIKADILNRPVISLAAKEAGACGTCMLASVAMGIYTGVYEAAKHFVREKKTFTPNGAYAKIYKKRYNTYEKIYPAVKEILKGEI